jgi:hypothetical protein
MIVDLSETSDQKKARSIKGEAKMAAELKTANL